MVSYVAYDIPKAELTTGATEAAAAPAAAPAMAVPHCCTAVQAAALVQTAAPRQEQKELNQRYRK